MKRPSWCDLGRHRQRVLAGWYWDGKRLFRDLVRPLVIGNDTRVTRLTISRMDSGRFRLTSDNYNGFLLDLSSVDLCRHVANLIASDCGGWKE